MSRFARSLKYVLLAPTKMTSRSSSRTTRAPDPSSEAERGQSFVELALLLPLILFMALAVFDFARVLTTAITVEAAAREAADYGGLYPWHWNSADPDWDPVIEAVPAVVNEMTTRACAAASTLTDYDGLDPDTVPADDPVTCVNPTVTWELINDTPYDNCYDVPRNETPCRVEVTVVHDFNVIVPLRLTFGNTELGLPSQVTLTRTSTFAVSNFELDEAIAP